MAKEKSSPESVMGGLSMVVHGVGAGVGWILKDIGEENLSSGQIFKIKIGWELYIVWGSDWGWGDIQKLLESGTWVRTSIGAQKM